MRVIWTLLITGEPRLEAEFLSTGWCPAVVQGYSDAGEQQLSWPTTLILGHYTRDILVTVPTIAQHGDKVGPA